MKILMVSEDVPHPQLGGLGKHALGLAHALNRLGHEVDFLGNAERPIADMPDQAGPGAFFGEISGHARLWKRRQLGVFNPVEAPLNGRKVAAIIAARAPRYDVVHYHGHLPWLGVYLPAGTRFIQTRHDQGGDCMLKTRYRPDHGRCDAVNATDCAGCASQAPNELQRWVSAYAVERMRLLSAEAFSAHPVIFVSEFLRRNALRVLGPSERSHVIPNAVDTAALENALAQCSPPARRATIELFAAGAMFKYKGFGELLSCLVADPLPSHMRLSLAGDGPLLPQLRQQFQGLDGVRFLGWLAYPQVVAEMAACDAVVVPSLCDESCATTVLEALALGKTVYALDRGGTPELARFGHQGAGVLRLFASLPDLVAALKLQQASHVDPALVLSQFGGTMQAMAEQVLAVYAKQFPAVSVRS